MTKVPWCTKGQQNQGTVFVATYPGRCTSVDQFQSTQVGLIAQLKGKHTTQQYRYRNVFVDHFHCYQSSAQMLKAKQAYEQFAILNLDTGLVSLQFHCRYDDFFETISFNKPETTMSSNWQILACLTRLLWSNKFFKEHDHLSP
ncbi:hypothetical protein ACHAW6_001027 [Cyclotella cf. meneghiniana]